MSGELELFASSTGAAEEIVESRVARDRLVERVEVLDKVKALRMLPDGVHVTADLVANYFEVHPDATEACVRDNRTELETNGFRIIEGERLSAFKAECGYRSRAPRLGLFNRRAVLNVGMLLRDSEVAKRVRAMLLDTEAQATEVVTLDVTSLDGVEQILIAAQRSLAIAKAERQRADLAEARAAELEPLAEGYRIFLESDGTVKWRNACDYLGVAPNLFGAYLRSRKITYTDEYEVIRDGQPEKRQGERHNRPYADYAHWFAFPAYSESEKLDHVPEHRQHDRRVTKAGMDGLLRVLKRHVVECGRCSLCASVHRNKPAVYAAWRPEHPQRQIGA